MRIKCISLFLLLVMFLPSAGQVPDSALAPLKFRNIGPFRGGRSVAVSGVPGDPLTYFMGTTGGGLWKTADAGHSWRNISDGFFSTGSVGAVAVAASNANIVYCGMGEHAPRGVMTSYGDGVYKSTDGGKTWEYMGLEETQHISRIVIHPDNPDIVYVAAQGALYGPNEERGVFKSIDGGATWEKMLYLNDLTGCSELSMDIHNPRVLYAAMWEHQRKPWKVISGGEGSGLYKSTDGGKSWKKIHNGLPEEKGKMAVAVCRSNPEKVYALIESDSDLEKGGLFVSDNAGNSWRKVSSDHRLVQRAWYYIELFPDPKDENTVYVLSAPALKSIDGGKTWERLKGDTHGDYHDLWINPDNSENMVIANDGGAAISFDQGNSWSAQDNLPIGQIYRINTDNLYPYRIYGGQQDYSSVRIANMSLSSGGISDSDWDPSAGGESAFLAFDPDNPRYVLGGSYLGTIEVLDTKSGGSTNIMPAPIQYLGRAARDMKYLYNWNAPIIRSMYDENTYYHAAQYVLRTRDMGKSWEEVSPDLTRNIDEKQGNGGGPYTNEAVGAENYGTISYMVESPHEKGVIWTGSDDGKVYITRDGGENWDDVTPRDLGETLVNAIEVSPHDPATAYIATTRYKFNDYTPAIFKTTNYGKSWSNISEGIPYGSFTRVVREDPVKRDLLFAGTEKGLYKSYDGGRSWQSFKLNLPVTPITDLKIHNDDLIVATSGRSFWILDDLGLLRQFDPEIEFGIYTPNDAYLGHWSSEMNSNDADGIDLYEGVNPPNGVVLFYALPADGESLELRLDIYDADNRLVRSVSSQPDSLFESYAGGPPGPVTIDNNPGLNRFVWDMRHETMPGVPEVYIEASYRGHKVIPGTYRFVLTSGEKSAETEVRVLNNPLYDINEETYREYDAFMEKAEKELVGMHDMVVKLNDAREQVDRITKSLPGEERFDKLRFKGELLSRELQTWDGEMVQRKSKAYDDVENFPNKFTAEFLFMINHTESSIPRVNDPSKERYEELMVQWQQLKKRGEAFLNEGIPEFNKALWEEGIGAVSAGGVPSG